MIRLVIALAMMSLVAACGVDGAPHRPAAADVTQGN